MRACVRACVVGGWGGAGGGRAYEMCKHAHLSVISRLRRSVNSVIQGWIMGLL